MRASGRKQGYGKRGAEQQQARLRAKTRSDAPGGRAEDQHWGGQRQNQQRQQHPAPPNPQYNGGRHRPEQRRI